MTDPKPRTYCPPLVARAPLPDGHPLKREPMRPRGAGSEIRKGLRGYDEAGQFVPPKWFGITDANAERVLAAIRHDDTDLWTRIKCGLADLGTRARALPLLNALALVAVLTAGACVLVVGLAYGWGMFW